MQDIIFNPNPISENKIKEYNAISVAFVGDAVYSLFVRTYFAVRYKSKSSALHMLTSNVVKADAQAKAFDLIKEELSECEINFANIARNSHTKNIARGSTHENYKKSSELESVFGYNYLIGNNERLKYLLEKCISFSIES